ncbi:hypothetical protein JXR01_00175 [Candidatus Kaiserbacteria bacterium]|nr:MAG: hypothetical protein JXR01_00175 [Candidatus Kaiserbacteria bacterium]
MYISTTRDSEPFHDYSKVADSNGVAEFLIGREFIENAYKYGHIIRACSKDGRDGEFFEPDDLREHIESENPKDCKSVPLCILKGGIGCPEGR